ncbi:beta-N-acetylhexosaminidase [Flavisolibacter ginsenosidimutans]|uniref:beta-N-acetylhexosaminidase n=1 Tax=Flavisolibacter ginsenosidimutans TaxID=661481 RepID=A0A5B8UJL2_9BACT|nr:family 20 glycosylhydrolase [Flavisolibacter ginsenosidimutans]QEC56743.1 family 20 glycosylhydrolase [Flavisolibacter ginsenosidimutans]
MKKFRLLLLTALFAPAAFAQSPRIAIIPEPVSLTTKPGQFILPKSISIEAPANAELKTTTAFLQKMLSTATGYNVSISNTSAAAAVRLQLNKTSNPTLGTEGYQINVSSNGAVLKANTPVGLFYAAQTLIQLLPPQIESVEKQSNVQWSLPFVDITDYPRFGWRGLMFDVARHFFTKEEVKHFIDDMVRYKYNLLHLHLADDEGWRIQINSLPKLTEVGAWNVKKEGYFGTFSPPTPDEPRTYGGFYTQDDIREIVQYAKERFVNVLPEIDMPAHCLAAIASYPELSCTEGADKYRVRSGEQIMDWSHGAPPIAMVDNVLCPANEKVYEFADKVMTELATLFPFEYIHVGGDEAPHNFWEKDPQIKTLMNREGLKTMDAVQGYFERRLEKIVASKGKKMIGWDEVLDAGVSKSTAIMSWRGVKNGIEAAKQGHDVVMTPTTYAYLDYMQADPVIESRIYASLRLNKTYEFDPVSEGVDAARIKGGQGNLWTEQVYNYRQVQYMLWPRAFALAEDFWSPKNKKNWDDFFARTEQHFARYNEAEKKYAPSVYDPIFTVTRGADSTVRIALETEVKGLDIYYSFDNSFPDRFYPKYTAPLTPPKDAAQLKVVTYRGKQQVGRINVMAAEEWKRRAGLKK